MAESTDQKEMTEEERMAAEWEAMAGAGEGEGAGEGDAAGETQAETPTAPARALNQDEIDSLLGFDGQKSSDGSNSGVQAIVNSALVSYERLPMLEVVFDRLVRLMTTSLRNFTSDNVEVSLDAISSTRFGDYLNSVPLPAMMSVFRAEQWDNYGLITVDSALIYSIVDVLLGGRRGTAAMRIEGRPYTTIERNLVERLVTLILSDIGGAFEPLSKVNFKFERLETNPKFAAIARPANAAIVARLRVDMEDRGGRCELLIPYATLEPIRELLLQMFMGEKFGRDSIWESHLATELWQTDIEIDAVLDRQMMTLNDVINFKVGTRLMFNATASAEVELRCGEKPMFAGRMGRKGNNIAVCVDRTLTRSVVS